jgi:hypothetical protein
MSKNPRITANNAAHDPAELGKNYQLLSVARDFPSCWEHLLSVTKTHRSYVRGWPPTCHRERHNRTRAPDPSPLCPESCLPLRDSFGPRFQPIIGVPRALKTWERGSGELGVFLVAGWFRET